MSMSAMERVAARAWYHQIDLGNGYTTPGQDFSARKLAALNLPERLDGKTVLDVGAWDGFFSFECERRGAARVVASDGVCWAGPGIADGDGFNLAKEILNSGAEKHFSRVEDLDVDQLGSFDIILFLGVLYHAPDPLGYLRKMRSLCREMVVIETHVDLLEIDRPALAYYPGDSQNNDASNFFGPNEAAVVGLCQDAGFRNVIVVNRYYEPQRMVFHAFV